MASVRDHRLKEALEKQEELIIKYQDKTMTIPYSTLKNNLFQIHKTSFQSKFGNESYQLYDFRFKPDGLVREEQLMFI